MKQNESITSKIQLKACSKKDLVALYKVSWKILKVWLKFYEHEIGPRMGHYYTPKQMKIIYENLGIPGMTEILA